MSAKLSAKLRARCRRKIRYDTHDAAVAGRQEWAERTGREALLFLVAPYLCPVCGSFHLGGSKATRKRYVAHVMEKTAHSRA